MDLLHNPFHILTATPRDNIAKIMNLAEDLSLLVDSEQCMTASHALTAPRKRLSAEVAWLPGLSPKRGYELLSILELHPAEIIREEYIFSVAKANVLASALSRLPEYNAENITTWILTLAEAYEKIDLEELKNIINEERVGAGFPEVTELSAIEEELKERRRYYRQVAKDALDTLPSKELVESVTELIDITTCMGNFYCPDLIADILDTYEVEAQELLNKEEENFFALAEKLQISVKEKKADSIVDPIVTQLIDVMENWSFIAYPIQISAKSRCLEHEASVRVGQFLRNLAIDMFNKYQRLELCQHLIEAIRDIFTEVSTVIELLEKDAETLESLVKQRAQWLEEAPARDEQWRKEITYAASVGVIFKNTLRISPEEIEWEGRRWELDTITRVRWGGVKHSVNAIPTGTTYSIFFGNSSRHELIELRKNTTYSEFTDRLWKTVGIRLFTEYLEGFFSGKTYCFGNTTIKDTGMYFERVKFFGKNESVFCTWDEISIWNGPGVFCMGKRGDKKLIETFSYLENDNIHILEAIIRMFWRQGGTKLSNLLDIQRGLDT